MIVSSTASGMCTNSAPLPEDRRNFQSAHWAYLLGIISIPYPTGSGFHVPISKCHRLRLPPGWTLQTPLHPRNPTHIHELRPRHPHRRAPPRRPPLRPLLQAAPPASSRLRRLLFLKAPQSPPRHLRNFTKSMPDLGGSEIPTATKWSATRISEATRPNPPAPQRSDRACLAGVLAALRRHD